MQYLRWRAGYILKGIEGDLAAHGMAARNDWCFDSPDIEGLYADVASGRLDPRCAYITSASLKDPDTGGHAPDGVHGRVGRAEPGTLSTRSATEGVPGNGRMKMSPWLLWLACLVWVSVVATLGVAAGHKMGQAPRAARRD